MGAFFDEVPENCIDWISEQKIFFVATAPLSGSGTVNVSPKGHDVFHLVSPREAWYLDITGSGNETISHLREPGNGRITIMFTAFTGPPRILRLFGRGRVHERDSPQFNALLPPGDARRLPGARSIIWIDIERTGTSCGFSVPKYEYLEDRPTLLNYYAPKEALDAAYLSSLPPSSPSSQLTVAPASCVPKGLAAYWALKNAESVDGLPGLEKAGWPPAEGAVRKAKGVEGATKRLGSGAAVAVRREEDGWAAWARGWSWKTEMGVVAGLAVGWWLGRGGWAQLEEAFGL
ncbi:hypothetical protein JCM10207_009132 [Rhodosporidiobolus poonsookiae]